MHMKQLVFYKLPILITLSCLIWACSKDDPKPITGKLIITVADQASDAKLSGAQIILFNADSNSPTGSINISDENGILSIDLLPGNYFAKYYKQGYESVPARGMEAVPFTVMAGQTTEQLAELLVTSVTSPGLIRGKVTAGSGIGGVLIVAENDLGSDAFSTVSAEDGSYSIFNVPEGNYQVRGYVIGYNSNEVATAVIAGTEVAGVDLALTTGATGSLTGTVRNLAASNKDVDVSLVHPLTKETIPGLSTKSSSQAYSITKIPDGVYIARATFKNDQRVMDPDRIAKFGEPIVTFTGSSTIDLTFDVTDHVSLLGPSNESASVQPVLSTSGTPTFSWTDYSSTSDYVIEIIDASTGAVVWGGFDTTGDLPSKKIIIPSSQTTIDYNSDGKAIVPELVPGRIYRWRIFASKNDQNSPTGWTLISASEDQMGLIQISK